MPVTRYNVARNKEVMGCHPKAGPSISKIVGLNSSLLLWKSNAKKMEAFERKLQERQESKKEWLDKKIDEELGQ